MSNIQILECGDHSIRVDRVRNGVTIEVYKRLRTKPPVIIFKKKYSCRVAKNKRG